MVNIAQDLERNLFLNNGIEVSVQENDRFMASAAGLMKERLYQTWQEQSVATVEETRKLQGRRPWSDFIPETKGTPSRSSAWLTGRRWMRSTTPCTR